MVAIFDPEQGSTNLLPAIEACSSLIMVELFDALFRRHITCRICLCFSSSGNLLVASRADPGYLIGAAALLIKVCTHRISLGSPGPLKQASQTCLPPTHRRHTTTQMFPLGFSQAGATSINPPMLYNKKLHFIMCVIAIPQYYNCKCSF